MHHHKTMRLASIFALAAGITVPVSAADLTSTANPPRVLATTGGVSPLAIPKCATSDPTVPTPGIIYCYTPSFIYSAYACGLLSAAA